LASTGIGLAETAESTLVAWALPDRLRGSGFGLLGVVQAGGDFLSSAMVGLLWATVSPTVGFGYAAAWMAASLTAAVALGRVGAGRRAHGTRLAGRASGGSSRPHGVVRLGRSAPDRLGDRHAAERRPEPGHDAGRHVRGGVEPGAVLSIRRKASETALSPASSPRGHWRLCRHTVASPPLEGTITNTASVSANESDAKGQVRRDDSLCL
jgi:hypothetical protein